MKKRSDDIIYFEGDIEKIEALPQWIQDLEDKYPIAVRNTARDWDSPPVENPQTFEIFYGEPLDGPNSDYVEDGKLLDFSLKKPDLNVIHVAVHNWIGDFGYIQVENLVLLDKMNWGNLPDICIYPDRMVQAILRKILEEQLDEDLLF